MSVLRRWLSSPSVTEEAVSPDERWFNYLMLQELKCSCNLYMRLPIHQCIKGHASCAVCHTKRTDCATCGSSWSPTRNLPLERIAAKVKFPCCNQSTGCTGIYRVDEINTHEARCRHRVMRCALDPGYCHIQDENFVYFAVYWIGAEDGSERQKSTRKFYFDLSLISPRNRARAITHTNILCRKETQSIDLDAEQQLQNKKAKAVKISISSLEPLMNGDNAIKISLNLNKLSEKEKRKQPKLAVNKSLNRSSV